MIRYWGISDSDLYKEGLKNSRYMDGVILRRVCNTAGRYGCKQIL
jgi:hypothetical protein